MATARQIQNELLRIMRDLMDHSSPLDPISRKALYENLWNLYDIREEKIKNTPLTLEEQLDKIDAADMETVIVCTACGRTNYHLFGSIDALEREMSEPCWKCRCVGNKKLLGDPQRQEW